MDKIVEARVSISSSAEQTICDDVYKRSNIEACGVLLGTIDQYGNWFVTQAQPLRNTFHSPIYFEFDPEELLSIELEYPGQSIGVYHSHPTGFPVASQTDCKNMQRVNVEQQIPWIWLIIGGPFDNRTRCSDIGTAMTAYHHYTQAGLQQINIQFERGVEG